MSTARSLARRCPSSEAVRVAADRKGSNYRGTITVAAIVVLGLVLIGYLSHTDSSKLPAIIAAGVVGSLIATLVVLWLTYYVIEDPVFRIDRSADAVEASVAELERRLPLVSQAVRYGLNDVKPKSEYAPEEWLTLLQGARERLILVGHTLDKWCQEDFLPEFEHAIRRLAGAGKPVELLTLPEDGTNTHLLEKQRGDKYGERVRRCYQRVAVVHRSLDPAVRRNLRVHALHSNVAMPYMLVGNDAVVITCAYPTTSPGSGQMLTMTVDAGGDYGRALRSDARKLIDDYSDLVDLSKY